MASNQEKNKSETNNNSNDASTTKEKKPPKFVFNCTKCGQCCEKKEYVQVYLADLERWLSDGSLSYVLAYLQIQEEGPFGVKMVLKREKTDENPSGCPLYDYNNKICNLYSSIPLACAAYPLGYNGSKYYLIDKECPGLGNGTMTKESLAEARKKAQDNYNAKTKTESLFSIIYGTILNHIMKQSQEAMKSLSEEDRKKLEELLSKSKDAVDNQGKNETTENDVAT